MKHFIILQLCFFALGMSSAQAFCGFFVSKAGADLFNQASKVVLARADGRTVITMVNDYQGELDEFAIVIPVPSVITEKQVNVTEYRIIEHLDAYTAPRLVEYFDADPCQRRFSEYRMPARSGIAMEAARMAPKSAEALGVKIEAEYTVGEYDIVVLSAEQSDGLFTYLNQEGYQMPEGAPKVLNSYIKQDMKFFLAKVNLEEQAKAGSSYLRPLQVAYEHEKFMLPIRLGTLNAKGAQDLILYTLTQNGRVETSNYRTTKIPSDVSIPTYVKDEFASFYTSMFDEAVRKQGMKTIFLEYAWDMGWCDPCAADPLSNEDLKTLGVWWNGENNRGANPAGSPGVLRRVMPQPAANVFVTRLHARYDAENFPEDLMLHETSDRQNFQGRYILNHPWTEEASCEDSTRYFESLPKRFEKEAQTLSNVTGWKIDEIRKKMAENGQGFSGKPAAPKDWWESLWKK